MLIEVLKMYVAMDRAMVALTLDEEDVPFRMPEVPGVSSAEENALSLMGRALNPKCQNMPGLIRTMPRKWKKEGRVRGIALSQERFQFIFQSEHDLIDVLEKGVQTFNEWAMVLERWVENPPEDYLQYIPLWVRISHIPVNYYTIPALSALGDIVGKVKVVAFDPSQPVTQPYIRVYVIFNVAYPLRMLKLIDLGERKSATIHFNYENIQKRCFTCQRLNHEKRICPLEVRQRHEEAQLRRNRIIAEKKRMEPVLAPDDPLRGVLEESQVGVNPLTGRPKIATVVLEEMEKYIVSDTGEDIALNIEKIKKTVREVEADPITQKTVLSLEPLPVVTADLNRGKGLVFDYGERELDRRNLDLNVNPEKLLSASMRAMRCENVSNVMVIRNSETSRRDVNQPSGSLAICSTVFKHGSSEPFKSVTVSR